MIKGNHHIDKAQSLQTLMPDVYQQLLEVRETLESHFRDVCDFEFTIQEGQLFILGVRPARRTPRANLRFALQFFSEGKIGIRDVLNRVRLADVEDFIIPEIKNAASLLLLGTGLPASPGVATGEIVFCASDAVHLAQRGHLIILVKDEVNPDDIHAMDVSQGVLTTRGGMTSHAACVSRGMGKPCVAGFSELAINQETSNAIVLNCKVLEKGDWITIDSVTGRVFAGRGNFERRNWRDQPELLSLASIVKTALLSDDVNNEAIGRVWKLSDFFVHGVPLGRQQTSKRSTRSRTFASFTQPKPSVLKRLRSNLMPIPTGDRENYSLMIFSLADYLTRLLSSALGLGHHHLYFRPLWDPKRCVFLNNDLGGSQLVGFEFFGVNRHIAHLVDVSTIAIFVEIELRSKSDEWFLDFTNPDGESLVAPSDYVLAYYLLVNDAIVSYEDLPPLYNSLRHRERDWQFYNKNHISHQDIIDFLSIPSRGKARYNLSSLCHDLGLLSGGNLTSVGECLLGRDKRKGLNELVKFR